MDHHAHPIPPSHHGREELLGRQLWLGLDALPRLLRLIFLPAKDGPDDGGTDHAQEDEEIDIHDDDVRHQAPTEGVGEGRSPELSNQVAAEAKPGGVEGKRYEEEDESQDGQDLDQDGEFEAAA